jgi:hypothetical protein
LLFIPLISSSALPTTFALLLFIVRTWQESFYASVPSNMTVIATSTTTVPAEVSPGHELPSVTATLNYYLPGSSNTLYVQTAGYRLRKRESHRTIIHDIRGHEEEFKLDVHGFQLVHHPSRVPWDEDEVTLKDAIRNEAGEMLKSV